MDGLDLLVEVVLALAFLHLALHAPPDALFHLKDVDFVLQQLEQLFQSPGHQEHVQHRLLGIQLQRQVGGDGVREPTRVVDPRDGGQDLRRNLLVQLDVLVELLGDGSAERFDLGAALCGRRHRRHVANEVVAFVTDGLRGGALHALHQHLHRAVRQLQHLKDAGDATHLEHVLGLGLVFARGLLCHEHDLPTRLHGGLQRFDRLRPPHEQGNHHMGKHDHVAQRQQRQRDRLRRKNRMT